MTISTTWTRLVRYVGQDGQTHLGQPVDADVDVGLAVAAGEPVKVLQIDGDMYSGTVTTTEDVIKEASDATHAKEASLPMPNEPLVFIKPRTALAGPGDIPIPKAGQDDQLDFETELALVLSKDARDVSEADALDYVLGYTASNDVSMRKHQLANSQWCFGKGFDNSCPIGPVLVRVGGGEGAADPDNVDFTGVLSGETVQASNTSDMIFSCRRAIAFLSQGTTLERGSVIQMGTPSGIGWARTPQRYIKDGEEMRIWFEGVGTLVNRFVHEKA